LSGLSLKDSLPGATEREGTPERLNRVSTPKDLLSLPAKNFGQNTRLINPNYKGKVKTP